MAPFNSRSGKNCWFLNDAMIQVEMTPTVPSALALFFGRLIRAGITAVP